MGAPSLWPSASSPLHVCAISHRGGGPLILTLSFGKNKLPDSSPGPAGRSRSERRMATEEEESETQTDGTLPDLRMYAGTRRGGDRRRNVGAVTISPIPSRTFSGLLTGFTRLLPSNAAAALLARANCKPALTDIPQMDGAHRVGLEAAHLARGGGARHGVTAQEDPLASSSSWDAPASRSEPILDVQGVDPTPRPREPSWRLAPRRLSQTFRGARAWAIYLDNLG